MNKGIMKEKKTICLCAIVKNEEKTIARLIKSCKSIIDYYVIVDTGSTDDTINVIKSSMGNLPGEIHERPWVNFGANRTELMDLAYGKSDYLLLADADFEYKISNQFDKSQLKYDWYHLRYLGDVDFAQILFVTGKKKLWYTGVTHEYINGKDMGESPELKTLLVLHHADGGTRSDKLTRDRDLLEKAILDDPADTRNYFYLAQTYANLKEYEKAMKYYSERARRGGWQEEVYYSLYQIGVMQHLLKNDSSAIMQLGEAYSFRPTRFEALYYLALIYREQKKYHLARILQEEVLGMDYPKNDKLFIHSNYKTYQADFELAICYYWMGDYKKAKSHALYVKTKTYIPEHIKKQNEENLRFINEKLKTKSTGRNDIIYVSMFTSGTPYEEEVKTLQKSMDKFGLPYEIVGLRNKGSWEKNTQMKPQVLKSVMDKYNKDVVWIDADAEFVEAPELFYNLDCDIAFHHLKEWDEKMTGTMYFKNSIMSREILNKWIHENESNDLPDGPNFQKIMEQPRGLKIVDLPVEYINVVDIKFLQCAKPVIIQHQASRRFKDAVKVIAPIELQDIIRKELIKSVNGHKGCSVIGNGPFKSDLSKQIDNSFVMRCNNFKLGYKEIGTRIDLNISSLLKDILPEEKVDYPILGVLPISDTMYQEYSDAKFMHRFWLENAESLIQKGNIVWMYGDNEEYSKVFQEVTREINAFPTVGIMGIATARWMGFKKIIISGFTFFQIEKSHYFKEEKIKPSMHHNPIAEKQLLLKWINEDKGIKYILDKLTEDNLYSDAGIRSDAIKS
jgi:glycosyltransferase involved in cell wall biosynthesis